VRWIHLHSPICIVVFKVCLQCFPFKIVFKFPSCQPIIIIDRTGVISKTQISFCSTNKCMMWMFPSFLYSPTCSLFSVPWLFRLQDRVKTLHSSFCGALTHKIRVLMLYQAFNLISNASVWEYLPYLPQWPPKSLLHVPTVKHLAFWFSVTWIHSDKCDYCIKLILFTSYANNCAEK
jgi:hypothetical protein